MARSTMPGQGRLGVGIDRPAVAPAYAIHVVAALLALGIAAVHVADQGGVAAFTDPDWIGWSYRIIEAGGVATALVLLLPRPAWPDWAAGALLGAAPFAGYLASRTVGVPGDSGDVGNWGDWVGTVSLFLEAALLVLSISMLAAGRRHRA
jgi:hypothetical protein